MIPQPVLSLTAQYAFVSSTKLNETYVTRQLRIGRRQNYAGNEFPPLTVTNGLARFEAMGVHFAGYVTPQGHLKMSSGYGATISGNIKEVPVDEISMGF